MRPTPGNGWKQLSESVWENASNGVRIHLLGLIYDRAGGIPSHMRLRWSNYWPLSVQWDRHTAIAGGNRKRGLMTLALEIAKGGEP